MGGFGAVWTVAWGASQWAETHTMAVGLAGKRAAISSSQPRSAASSAAGSPRETKGQGPPPWGM